MSPTSPLRVKRGAVEDDLELRRALHALDTALRGQQREHPPGPGADLVADEGRPAPLVLDLRVDVAGQGAPLLFAGRAGTGPLLLHGPAEALVVDGEPLLLRHLQRQLGREPVGVVEGEDDVPGDLLPSLGLQTAGLRLEELRPLLEGPLEAVLLHLDDPLDGEALVEQFAIGVAHDPEQDGHVLAEERALEPQEPPVANGPAQQAAQHIARPVVGGQHAVGQHEGHGPDVVRDDAHSHVGPSSVASHWE